MMRGEFKTLCSCAIALLWSLAAHADVSAPQRTTTWPDTFVSRVEALALLETFNSELLTHDSATLTLEHWCDVHRLAAPPRVVAERVPNADKPPSPDQRRELEVGPADEVRYRRVRLLCGSVVLSEADNWYVPARLTREMNKLLDTTDVPFGRVVRELHFQRRTLSSKLLWLPLPDGWEMMASTGGDGSAALDIPPTILEHRAVLTLPDGTPFSEVIETYTNHILGFPAPFERGEHQEHSLGAEVK
jgi:chorismate-pyruvate lyase